jgi:hypothetical protein
MLGNAAVKFAGHKNTSTSLKYADEAVRAATRRCSCSITTDSGANSCSPGSWTAKQSDLKSKVFGNLPGVDSLRPAFDQCNVGTGECVHRAQKARTDLRGERRARIIEHHTCPEIPQPLLPWVS